MFRSIAFFLATALFLGTVAVQDIHANPLLIRLAAKSFLKGKPGSKASAVALATLKRYVKTNPGAR